MEHHALSLGCAHPTLDTTALNNNANEQEWRRNKISTFFCRPLGLTNVAQKWNHSEEVNTDCLRLLAKVTEMRMF
jgi:hypothetical protein